MAIRTLVGGAILGLLGLAGCDRLTGAPPSCAQWEVKFIPIRDASTATARAEGWDPFAVDAGGVVAKRCGRRATD